MIKILLYSLNRGQTFEAWLLGPLLYTVSEYEGERKFSRIPTLARKRLE